MAPPLIAELLTVYGELKRWLGRQTRNADAAADLVQASVERVLGHATHADIPSPRGLLFQTVRHLLIDAARREALARWEALTIAPEECPMPAALVHARTPEQDAINRDLLARLGTAIDALPPRCREAFVLNRIHGLSHAEVTRQLGISRSAVEKHVMRGLHACRAIMTDELCEGNHALQT
jgi:RNA polymerase sigma-70 factor (ECF subfamily)